MKKILSIVFSASLIFAVSMLTSSCDLFDFTLNSVEVVEDETDTPDDNILEEDSELTENSQFEEKSEFEEEKETESDADIKIRTTITVEDLNVYKDIYNYSCFAEAVSEDNIKIEWSDVNSDTVCLKKGMILGRGTWVLVDDVWYKIKKEESGTFGYVDKDYTPTSLADILQLYMIAEFDELVYDEEKGAYYTGFVDGEMFSVEGWIRFEISDVIKMVVDCDMYDYVCSHVTFTLTITDIGTTEIEIPQFTIDGNNDQSASDYTVTKDEWQSALSMEILPSSAAQTVCELYNVPSEYSCFVYYDVIEMCGNVIHQYEMNEERTTIISEQYYCKNGDSYVKYLLHISNDIWITSEITESEYNSCTIYNTRVSWNKEDDLNSLFLYEAFVYDSEKKAYKCSMIESIQEGVPTMYNVELKFNNGKLESYYFEAVINGYNSCFTEFGYDEITLIVPQIKN